MDTESTQSTTTNRKIPHVFEIQPDDPKPLRQTYLRWVVLFLINILAIGDFIAIEGPQPIETQMKTILGINEEQYSLLYTSWAIPSIITPLFGGYLIDKFGDRVTLMAFSLLVTLGQFIYAYGGYALSFSWMVAGRTVYAIGTDPFYVVLMVVINKWFKGKELALAISLTGSCFGIGRALNSILTPLFFEMNQKLWTPMLFVACLCALGSALSIILLKWDAENERIERRIYPGLYLKQEAAEKVKLGDMKYFSRLAWLLIFNFGLIYGVSFSFNAFANDLYHVRYQFTNVQAGSLISSNFLMMALSSAVCGKFIDHYAKRTSLQLSGSVCGLLALLYLFFVSSGFQNPEMIIPQLLLGFQCGIVEAVACPGLPLVMKSKFLGTGYGLLFVVENILVLILPYLAAIIKEKTTTANNDGFSGMILFFMGWSVLIILTAIWLVFEDNKCGGVLENSTETELQEAEGNDEKSSLYRQIGDY